MISTICRPDTSITTLRRTFEEDLEACLASYKGWKDVLSVRIRRWATRLNRDSIEQLFKEVLTDCIQGKPLANPVLERVWTWEKHSHSSYRSRCDRSPMDGETMLEDPPAHDFALAIVKLVSEYSLMAGIPIPTSKELELVTADGLFSDAQDAFVAEVFKEMGEISVEADRAQARIVEEHKILTHIAMAETEKIMDSHLETITAEIKVMEARYSEGIEDLERQLLARSKNHKKSMERMQKRVDCLEVTREEEVSMIKARMQACQNSYEASRRILEGHLDSQRAMHATLTRKIESLESTSAGVVADLDKEKKLTEEQESRIERLAGQLRDAHLRIEDLEDDDGFCVMM